MVYIKNQSQSTAFSLILRTFHHTSPQLLTISALYDRIDSYWKAQYIEHLKEELKMGSANLCDKELLKPGDDCIIEVDSVNIPTGLWWGEVISVEEHDTYISVKAKITGGCFQVVGSHKAIRSDEHAKRVPHVNYTVYPDTKTVRQLFSQLQQSKNETAAARKNARQCKSTHLDTMEHLVRSGVVKDA